MGFSDFFMNIMQKFTPVDLSLERYSQKELIVMKEQGYKVEEVQKYLDLYEKGEHPKQIKGAVRIEKNRIKNQLRRLRFEDLSEIDLSLEEIPNPTDLSKMKPYLGVHVNPEMKIIKDSLRNSAFNEKDFEDNQIALSSVVQSAPDFWIKESTISYAALVFTYVKQGDYLNNVKFLKLICQTIIKFRDEKSCPDSLSQEMKKLYDDLDNPKSEFHIHLDQSFLDYYEITFEGKKVVSNDIFVATTYKTQSEKEILPNSSFPSDGILPLICLNSTSLIKKKKSAYFNFVDGEYYKQ